VIVCETHAARPPATRKTVIVECGVRREIEVPVRHVVMRDGDAHGCLYCMEERGDEYGLRRERTSLEPWRWLATP
jgi:hypothetical protein